MIFKKSAIQGNFILSSGEQILFVDNHFETEDENIISQLKPIYEAVESKPEVVEKPKAAPALRGMASSASIAAVTK